MILVCRTHFTGLESAQAALSQWASGSVPNIRLLGLVMISDAPGKQPKALKDYSKLVAGGAPRTWELPWIEAWRTDPPSSESKQTVTNRKLRRFIRSTEQLLV